MAPAARRKANRLRIVCGLRPANNRPPGAARGRTDHAVARPDRPGSYGLGAAAARWPPPASDGALWSRLMNTIRRFYRSTTGPRDCAVVRSARGSARRRIDRPPEPLNSPGPGALYYTANHVPDSSRYLLRLQRQVERDRRVAAC